MRYFMKIIGFMIDLLNEVCHTYSQKQSLNDLGIIPKWFKNPIAEAKHFPFN